jgi:osmotically-inducible protein OsmY
MRIFNRFAPFFAPVLLASFLGCAAQGCGATAKHESTGEYVDDSVLTAKVKAGVFGESSLKSSEINVETFKGVVQLSGFVSSQADIDKAVQVARNVKGVKSVKNDMRVKGQQ